MPARFKLTRHVDAQRQRVFAAVYVRPYHRTCAADLEGVAAGSGLASATSS